MSELATTRMSSKGQVVIPEAIRKRSGYQGIIVFTPKEFMARYLE